VGRLHGMLPRSMGGRPGRRLTAIARLVSFRVGAAPFSSRQFSPPWGRGARTLRTEQCVKSQCVSPSAGRRGSPRLESQRTVRTHETSPSGQLHGRITKRPRRQCLSPRPAHQEGSQPRRIAAWISVDLYGEFDPGSGRTLAACLTHASRTVNRASARGSVANGCVTRGQPAPDTGITPGNRG
jgi:hypothetical protein